jgi:aminomethyltransferase
VSHMGEFMITGARAVDFVNHVTTNDVAALAIGQVHYSTILNDRGTIEDDCLVYRFADRIMMVVNASNAAKDFTHILRPAARFGVGLRDASDETALLALQGPKAAEILQGLTATDLSTIKYYHFVEGAVAGHAAIISRTGYTGEDGFELYIPNESAVPLWNAILATGRVTPAGLGARDTLRLEMGMALYGNDIDDTITPWEADLAWIVKMNKGEFIGREALAAQKQAGVARRLAGFEMVDRGIARHGYPAKTPSGAGVVTSGTHSPTLGKPIGLALLPAAAGAIGAEFDVEIRGRDARARVVPTPFYRRPNA